MGQAAVNRAARKAKRVRVTGSDARCARCRWADPTALTRSGDTVLCYECQRSDKGRRNVEDHHILGRANDPATVPVPGNLHRQLSDSQHDWLGGLRTNPNRDPLVWLAQGCQGASDHVAWWARILAGLAVWLLGLAAALQRIHGVTWWASLGIPSLWEVLAP